MENNWEEAAKEYIMERSIFKTNVRFDFIAGAKHAEKLLTSQIEELKKEVARLKEDNDDYSQAIDDNAQTYQNNLQELKEQLQEMNMYKVEAFGQLKEIELILKEKLESEKEAVNKTIDEVTAILCDYFAVVEDGNRFVTVENEDILKRIEKLRK